MAWIKNPFNKEKKPAADERGFEVSKSVETIEPAAGLARQPEKARERGVAETEPVAREKLDSAESGQPNLTAGAPAAAAQTSAGKIKSAELRRIEDILSDGLEDIYFNLDEAHRKLFREEGERAARQIESILHSGKSLAVKVLEVIKRWLKLIPGVNKFFVEQEAKIRTDAILKMNDPRD